MLNRRRIYQALNNSVNLLRMLRGGKFIVRSAVSAHHVQLPNCVTLTNGQINDYCDEKSLKAYKLSECELEETKCTCSDFVHRGQPCNHIFFVLLKVLNIKCDVDVNAHKRWRRAIQLHANTAKPVKTTQLVLNTIRPDNALMNQECSICIDEIEKDQIECQEIAYCHNCRYGFHLQCVTVWISTQHRIHNTQKSCPRCRIEF